VAGTELVGGKRKEGGISCSRSCTLFFGGKRGKCHHFCNSLGRKGGRIM